MKSILPIIIAAIAASVLVAIRWTRRPSVLKARRIAFQVKFQVEMRKKLLQGSPTKLGIDTKTIRNGVWGALMEIGFPEGVAATVVCLCDGTTSLYMGRGGGIIGGQGHESVRAAGAKFLDLAVDFVQEMPKADAYPMPDNGRVRFCIMTSSGVCFVDEDTQTLAEGKHRLSPLFYAGNEVITRLRQTGPSRAEMDSLLDNGIKAAVNLLEKNAEFYPFGIALQPDGKISLVAAWEGDEHPKSDDVLAFLYRAMKQGVRKGDYTAVAIVTDVKIRKTPSDEPKDALRIQIEHPDAVPVACHLPYRLEAGKFVQGELTTERAEPLVIGTRE